MWFQGSQGAGPYLFCKGSKWKEANERNGYCHFLLDKYFMLILNLKKKTVNSTFCEKKTIITGKIADIRQNGKTYICGVYVIYAPL